MKNYRSIIFSVLAVVGISAYADENFKPTDEDFESLNRQAEYYKALQGMNDAKQSAIASSVTEMTQSSESASDRNAQTPRNLRGRAGGDRMQLDANGRLISTAPPPEAFVSSIFGANGNLSAQVVWGDREFSVRKGDSVIGGNWTVHSVNQSGVIISDGDRRIQLSSIPVKINELMQSAQ